MQSNYSDRVHIIGCLEMGSWAGQGRGRILKTCERTFWVDGYVHYLDHGDSFLGVYLYENITSYVLYICEFLLYQLCLNKARTKEKKLYGKNVGLSLGLKPQALFY